MARKVWLGNNSARTLTVGGKTVAIGAEEKERTVNIDAKVQKSLEERGHRFADPGSDEADDPPTRDDGTGVPPIPASGGASSEGQPAKTGARK